MSALFIQVFKVLALSLWRTYADCSFIFVFIENMYDSETGKSHKCLICFLLKHVW